MLGMYQLIGGSIGLIMVFFLALSSADIFSLAFLIIAFMVLFFIYSCFCGVLCLRLKPAALNHSLANQFLQLISLTIPGFAFMYVAGIYFMIGVDLSQTFEISFGVGISGFKININQDSGETAVNMNLIALAIIIWIERLKIKIKSEKTTIELSSIGQP